MPKDIKLKLKELEVRSFITNLSKNEYANLKGGEWGDPTPNSSTFEDTMCPTPTTTEQGICPETETTCVK